MNNNKIEIIERHSHMEEKVKLDKDWYQKYQEKLKQNKDSQEEFVKWLEE